MLGNGHVRFGGRAEETDREQSRNRASARPHTLPICKATNMRLAARIIVDQLLAGSA
jgi:hypothetical protein